MERYAMRSPYRAFWRGEMWEVKGISFKTPIDVELGIIWFVDLRDEKKAFNYLGVRSEGILLMRNTGRKDISGAFVYEGDVIENPDGLRMEIKYGLHDAYCPADKCMMDSVGFYAVGKGLPQMPIGCLEDYALVVGNVHENPELTAEGTSDV